MSQRRTLILIAAIVIGAFASFLVWNYVGGIQDQAYSDAERVKVFLVQEPIAKGTNGGIAMADISPEEIPRKFTPANAIKSLDDIQGMVARADLVPNQVVVADMFVEPTDPDARQSFAEENLPKIENEHQTTYSVSIDEVRGVAGLIVPGDYVNILVLKFAEVTNGSTSGAADDADEAATVTDYQARFLYQKVRVLAVGSQTVGTSAPAADGTTPAPVVSSGLITFIVPVEASQILASIPPENLYLTLVSKDYTPKATGEIDIAQLPSDNPGIITPYGPDGAQSDN